MDRLLTIAGKDIKLIARDRGALLVMLAMPFALIFILGSALGGIGQGDSLDVDVAIVNHDAGGTGKHFVDGLTSSPEVDELFNIAVRDDADQVRTDVEKGDLTAALIIPEDLTSRIMAGEPAALEVLQDPGSEIAAGIWSGVARAAAANLSAGQVIRVTVADALAGAGVPAGAQDEQTGGHDHEIELDAVVVEEAEVDTDTRVGMIDFYAAGQTAMFLLFGSMFGAFTFVKERREQTLARALTTPTSKFQIVGGKSLGILGVAAGQFLVLYIGTMLIFRVDWGNAPAATVVVGIAEAWAATGLGMALAALGKTERSIGGIGPAVIMLFGAVGGSMIPAEFMPAWMAPIQSVSPSYWALESFLGLMRGEAASTVIGPVAILLGIGAALYAFGVWRLRYE